MSGRLECWELPVALRIVGAAGYHGMVCPEIFFNFL